MHSVVHKPVLYLVVATLGAVHSCYKASGLDGSVCVRVRACVRACVRAACVRVRVRACDVHVRAYDSIIIVNMRSSFDASRVLSLESPTASFL
jgi:hypothetical protein